MARDPCELVAARCRALGTDVFATRILLRRTICMTGPAAAEPFETSNGAAATSPQARACAGEWITIELLRRTATFLTSAITYRVPQQDLRLDRARLPALPPSRFVISDVHVLDACPAAY